MRNLFVPAIAMVLLAAGSAAQGAEMTGVVESVDEAARTVTLEDGTVLEAAEGVSLDDIEAGSTVTIEYEEAGDTMTASKIEPAE